MKVSDEIRKEIIELVREVGEQTLEENTYILYYDKLVKYFNGNTDMANKVLVWLRQNGMIIDHQLDTRIKYVNLIPIRVIKELYIVRIP
jgi:penicillin-binding protein-related factor A (putative recombinase)